MSCIELANGSIIFAASPAIKALFLHRELPRELIAKGLPPGPVEALCDRHGWRWPSAADYAFIDACAERLKARLAVAVYDSRVG